MKGLCFMMRLLLWTACVQLTAVAVFAQNTADPSAAHVDDSLNYTDAQHRKQGLWYAHHEPLRGEPAYTEFGTYVDDKKNGLWYQLDDMGQLVSIQNYYNGLLHGTSRYFEDGKLVCIGNFRSLNQEKTYDSIWVTNPITLYDTLIVLPAEYGTVKHGLWRYYDPSTGHLLSEERYQMDQLISKKVFGHRHSRTVKPIPFPGGEKAEAERRSKFLKEKIGY